MACAARHGSSATSASSTSSPTDAKRSGTRAMQRAELLLLGVSHKTAPVALRERLALTDAQADALLSELVAPRGDPRGRRDLDVQPHRDLPRRRRPGRRPRARCSACLAPARGHPPDRARRRRLLAAQLRRRAPPVPRRRRPRVDGRRRGRGPGPGQARLRASRWRAGTTGPLTNRLFTRRAAAPASACAPRPRSARARASRLDRRRRRWRARPSATSPTATS